MPKREKGKIPDRPALTRPGRGNGRAGTREAPATVPAIWPGHNPRGPGHLAGPGRALWPATHPSPSAPRPVRPVPRPGARATAMRCGGRR